MVDRIGDIVARARTAAGLSPEALAQRADIPLASLTALERGAPGVTTTQLDRLAEELALDPTALMKGREVAHRVPSVFLRHAPVQDFDDQDSAALDDALDQGRLLASLGEMLGEVPAGWRAGPFARRAAAADRADAAAQDGYQRARDVRAYLGNASDPLGDLGKLLEERFGVALVVRNLASPAVTAVGVRDDGGASAVLNGRDPQRERNPLLARVYIAHELCHILFDPSEGGLHLVVDFASDRKMHLAEQRARAFAAELLLPLQGLTDLLGPPGHVSATAPARDLTARARRHFGAPHEIAANHLCNLGFIDRSLREWLVASRTTFLGPAVETSLPPPDRPSRLVRARVERAHHEGLLTDGEARSALGLDRVEPLPWDEVEL